MPHFPGRESGMGCTDAGKVRVVALLYVGIGVYGEASCEVVKWMRGLFQRVGEGL